MGLAKLSRLMADLVGRMINPFASLLGLISGLWFLGVDPTTLLAGLGVAGLQAAEIEYAIDFDGPIQDALADNPSRSIAISRTLLASAPVRQCWRIWRLAI